MKKTKKQIEIEKRLKAVENTHGIWKDTDKKIPQLYQPVLELDLETISVDIDKDEITISCDEYEVVHWVKDEWTENPMIVTAIANAIHLAYTNPSFLVYLNRKHILSQIEME